MRHESARTGTSVSPPSSSQPQASNTRPTHASRAQASGHNRFQALFKTYSQELESHEPGSSAPADENHVDHERRLQREDEKAVDDELAHYERMPIRSIDRQVNLVVHWEVCCESIWLASKPSIDYFPFARTTRVHCHFCIAFPLMFCLYKHRLCPVSAFSRLARKLILCSGLICLLRSWRFFKSSNTAYVKSTSASLMFGLLQTPL